MREVGKPRKTWSQRVDSFVGLFSPRRKAARVAWRNAENSLREYSYRSALHSRTGSSRTYSGSADYHLELGYDREEMVDRSRQAERNNVVAAGLLTRCVENVIGCGIIPRADTDDDGWNDQAEALFADWCYRGRCDVRGIDSFYDKQRLTFRSFLRDGDVGTVLVEAGSRRGMLQSVESDEIASPVGKVLGSDHVDGIDLDPYGKPTKFHIVRDKLRQKRAAKRDASTGRVTVDAKNFLFLARRTRLNQTRGEPVLAQGLRLLEHLDGNIEAVTVAVRMAACFGLVLEGSGAPEGLPQVTGSNGEQYRQWTLEPGMIKRLEDGDSLTQIKPEQPATNFREFTNVLGRMIGLPLGLPLELLFLDFSQTNYSSARAALLQAYRAFQCLQQEFVEGFVRPVWEWKVRQFVEEGLLAERPDMYRAQYITPAWQWVDPVKEVQSNLAAVDAGMDTLSNVARSLGRDFDGIMRTRAREINAMKAAGVPLVQSNLTRALEDPDAEQAAQDKITREREREREREQAQAQIDALEERNRMHVALFETDAVRQGEAQTRSLRMRDTARAIERSL